MPPGLHSFRQTAEDRAGVAGWSALLGTVLRDDEDLQGLAAWAERMGDLISPALADHLLAEAGAGAPRIRPERATKAQLYNRFLLRRQVEAVRLVRQTGASFVCLKGFALAHQAYRRPEARILGDVDLLLRLEDLPKVASRLRAAGYAAMPIPSRFGFIARSSFLPIVSADGQVALDLHVAADAWPASRALGTEAVFGRARPFQVEEMELLGPAPEHAFFLVVTNIAKDRFGPEGVRKVVDAAMLLRRGPDFDWQLVATLAKAGGFERSLAALLRLMERLGSPTGGPAQPSASISGLAAAEVDCVARAYRRAIVAPLGLAGKMRRELLLGPELTSVLRINARRLYGYFKPGSGLPPGILERRLRPDRR